MVLDVLQVSDMCGGIRPRWGRLTAAKSKKVLDEAVDSASKPNLGTLSKIRQSLFRESI
jgi:hypothetical protein